MKSLAAPFFVPNLLLFSAFLLMVSLAVFLPLSFLKLASPASSSLVLGQSTASEQIQVRPVSAVENSAVSLSALAYPDQKTYYHNIFKIKNTSSEAKKYKLEVLSILPGDPNLSVQVYFESPDQAGRLSLGPGQEKEASLVLALGPSADGATGPLSYTLKILVMSID